MLWTLAFLLHFSWAEDFSPIQWTKIEEVKKLKGDDIVYFVEGVAKGYSHIRVLKGHLCSAEGVVKQVNSYTSSPSNFAYTDKDGKFSVFIRIGKAKLPLELWAASEINGTTLKSSQDPNQFIERKIAAVESLRGPVYAPRAKKYEVKITYGLGSSVNETVAETAGTNLNVDGGTANHFIFDVQRPLGPRWSFLGSGEISSFNINGGEYPSRVESIDVWDYAIGLNYAFLRDGENKNPGMRLGAYAGENKIPYLRGYDNDGVTTVSPSTVRIQWLGLRIELPLNSTRGRWNSHLEFHAAQGFGSSNDLSSATRYGAGLSSGLWLFETWSIVSRLEWRYQTATFTSTNLFDDSNAEFQATQTTTLLGVGAASTF